MHPEIVDRAGAWVQVDDGDGHALLWRLDGWGVWAELCTRRQDGDGTGLGHAEASSYRCLRGGPAPWPPARRAGSVGSLLRMGADLQTRTTHSGWPRLRRGRMRHDRGTHPRSRRVVRRSGCCSSMICSLMRSGCGILWVLCVRPGRCGRPRSKWCSVPPPRRELGRGISRQPL